MEAPCSSAYRRYLACGNTCRVQARCIPIPEQTTAGCRGAGIPYTDSDCYGDTHSNAHRYRDHDTYPDANTDSDGDSNDNGHSHRDADTYANCHRHGNPDPISDIDRYSHGIAAAATGYADNPTTQRHARSRDQPQPGVTINTTRPAAAGTCQLFCLVRCRRLG